MKCLDCGLDNLDYAKFCFTCGAEFSKTMPDEVPQSYRVGFSTAIKLGFKKYFKFSGGSTRAEFWWFALIYAVSYVTFYATSFFEYSPWSLINIVSAFCILGTFIPFLTVGVRRLHDSNTTAWWMLIALIPFLQIVLVVFWCTESHETGNRYGRNPNMIPPNYR